MNSDCSERSLYCACYIGIVKRKRTIPDAESLEPIVSAAIIEEAKRAIESDRMKRPQACIVCGGECNANLATNAGEPLCWVCRRLKLSAWRDSDSQLSAQE